MLDMAATCAHASAKFPPLHNYTALRQLVCPSSTCSAAQPPCTRYLATTMQVVATNKVLASQPYLCFFQGGPGFESPVPSEDVSWLVAATKHFRVLLLDQRGTGCSAPLRASSLAFIGTVDAQVDYLRHFRADSIVADAELFRRALDTHTGEQKRWCVLGQSFGGFCCVNYLSTAPEGAPPRVCHPRNCAAPYWI
jgi:alpha/beta hydrolase fold